MAAPDDERPFDPTEQPVQLGAGTAGHRPAPGDVDTPTAPERVSIHGIADKVKGLLRPRI